MVLDVSRLGISFGQEPLFSDVSFSINEGESISIVGPNGSGKSTLLKIIMRLERPDSGQVSIKRGTKVAYIDQTASSIVDNRPVYEILREAFGKLAEMEQRLEKLNILLEERIGESNYDEILLEYCDLLEKFNASGGYEINADIDKVLAGLNIDSSLLGRSYNELSGGEKTLIQLVKALLTKPDLLLLDEPTNHLDISRIEWLERYIKSFKGASVIISHDRYFLDRISNKILDLENGTGRVYATNYTGFLEEKERAFQKLLTDYNAQQAYLKKLEEQRKYFAERGMATNSSTLCDRAHSLQTQIERIKRNAITKPKKQRRLSIGFAEERKSSKRVIAVEGLTVLNSDGDVILDDINLEIRTGERVALIGPNGSGKSTFIKSVVGQQDLPMDGEISVGPSVKIGYLPQIIDFPEGDEKVLDYFRGAIGADEQMARRILANFQFYQEDINRRVKDLSGGERMRIKLAELLQQQINTLIFDEPTNHIDIPTREVLEEALDDFNGTLVFVSHDRYFINKFADKTIEFKEGEITTYLGNYDDYIEQKNRRREGKQSRDTKNGFRESLKVKNTSVTKRKKTKNTGRRERGER